MVHSELCHRAGFSIEWRRSMKVDYLSALSREIESPRRGILDAYVRGLKAFERNAFGAMASMSTDRRTSLRGTFR